mgnify:FL=1
MSKDEIISAKKILELKIAAREVIKWKDEFDDELAIAIDNLETVISEMDN